MIPKLCRRQQELVVYVKEHLRFDKSEAKGGDEIEGQQCGKVVQWAWQGCEQSSPLRLSCSWIQFLCTDEGRSRLRNFHKGKQQPEEGQCGRNDERRSEPPAVEEYSSKCRAKNETGAIAPHHDTHPLAAPLLGYSICHHTHGCWEQACRDSSLEQAACSKIFPSAN